MPKIKLRAKDKVIYDKISEAYEKTEIVQRQRQLTSGRWDFVVFGQADKNQTVFREGFAEHASIKRAPIYIASLAQSGLTDVNGIPIEEFIEENIPEKYKGLEIIQVDPLRPLTIVKKDNYSGKKGADKICREYEEVNIAVIRSPHETDWMISVMKYLNECDQNFPDPVQQAFSGRASQDIFSLGHTRPSSSKLN
ncbi:MAG: hypothetical protein H8E32_08490 [Nitrospinae bacterium]|nr:hypothetical protein [Nitrospinota bacterium]